MRKMPLQYTPNWFQNVLAQNILNVLLLGFVVKCIIKYVNEFQMVNYGEWLWEIQTIHIENKNGLLE